MKSLHPGTVAGSVAAVGPAALLVLIVSAGSAAAQAGGTAAASDGLGGWMPLITTVLETLVTMLIGWLATQVSRKTGVDIDAAHRDALQQAAMTGINLALARSGTPLSALGPLERKALQPDVTAWLQRSVPDALNHFGLNKDPAKLNDFVSSKIMQSTTATGAADGSADTIGSLMQLASAGATYTPKDFVLAILRRRYQGAPVVLGEPFTDHGFTQETMDGLSDEINDTHWQGVFLEKQEIRQCRTPNDLIRLVSRSLHRYEV